MITVARAPAWLVVQDLGWARYRAIGMPTGGAMDRHALAVANLLVGNSPDAAGLEWALGGGTIRFEQATVFSLAGATVEATLGGQPVAMHTTQHAEAHEDLTITRFATGQFAYLAVHGGVGVEPVLGSRSTHVRGGFGGLHGRRIRGGDFLPLGTAGGGAPPAGFTAPAELAPSYQATPIRVTPGPQIQSFDPGEADHLVTTDWLLAAASDRMGFRLKGATITPKASATQASEPACPGAVQVPDEGGPIILMADGPTVGGYPKLAVVCSADLGRLAQRAPGGSIQFSWITIEEAQRLYRRRAIQLHTLASLVTTARQS